MNHKLKLTIASITCLVALSSCAFSHEKPSDEKIDTKKTQIYVDNYNGGVGSEWLTKIKARFEKENANYKGINDKKGVQVIISNHKNGGAQIINSIAGAPKDVYFTEKMFFYDLVSQNLALDISDVVTDVNSDGKTIESKLNEEQKNYFNYHNNYYALPHYEIYGGIIYNVKMFEEHNLYFSDNPSVNGGFVVDSQQTKSAGPDGISGTYDDGLPSTYDEFAKLMVRMYDVESVIPFTWSGQYGKSYMNFLLEALFADYEGKDQLMLNLNFGGSEGKTAKNLCTVDNTGVVNMLGDTTVKTSTGYKMYSTAGRYHALKFVDNIVKNDKQYDKNKVASGSDTHTDAQTRFLLSDYELDGDKIAMLVEGTHWENEAKGVGAFDVLKNTYNVDASEVKFGFMPMPKVDSTKLGKSTVVDRFYTCSFLNANLQTRAPEKIDLCKSFLKYCYTDESLVEFTTTTNVPKALNYSLTEQDKAKMSYFGKSVFSVKENADIVYPYCTEPIYMNNQSTFALVESFTTNDYQFAYTALKNDGVTAAQYFNKIVNYHTETDWVAKYSKYF